MAILTPKIVGYSINFLSYISPAYAAKLAVLLFSSPRDAKLDEEAIQYLSLAEPKDIPHNDFIIKTYRLELGWKSFLWFSKG